MTKYDSIHFRLPAYNEIPDVGLYLEQVAKFINSYLQDFPEMLVTPSMISNYAKQKLIDRVHRKTYSRRQIAMLIFIVCGKTVLSITHIRGALTDLQKDDPDFNKTYRAFTRTLEQVTDQLFAESGEACTAEGCTILDQIAVAVGHKMFLEHYFESRQSGS